jgi:hypothetical protein
LLFWCLLGKTHNYLKLNNKIGVDRPSGSHFIFSLSFSKIYPGMRSHTEEQCTGTLMFETHLILVEILSEIHLILARFYPRFIRFWSRSYPKCIRFETRNRQMFRNKRKGGVWGGTPQLRTAQSWRHHNAAIPNIYSYSGMANRRKVKSLIPAQGGVWGGTPQFRTTESWLTR